MNAYKFRLTEFATSYTVIILAENKKRLSIFFAKNITKIKMQRRVL